tara:strand:- start:1064 stop:1873 length:810 start_codon:yes stop_codon:yes gene_type:complete
MQLGDQPILALNKAIKYGSFLIAIAFIRPAINYRRLKKLDIFGINSEGKGFLKKHLFSGFIWAFCLFLPITTAFWLLDIRDFSFDFIINLDFFIYTLFLAILSSLLIGVIEELFFRGVLVQESFHNVSILLIVITSSLIFSAFHFIKIPEILDPVIRWDTGLMYLYEAITGYNITFKVDAFVSLFLFGVGLSIIKIRTKSVYYCIGLHACFVFLIKIYKQNSVVNFNSDYIGYISTYDHFIGLVAIFFLFLYVSVYIFYILSNDVKNTY